MRRRWLALVALSLCLASCAAGPWTATFDKADDWNLSSDAAAEVRVAEGRLLIHILEPGQVAWASAGQTFGDVHLTVDATQVSGPADNEYGVLLRMDGDASFYAFSVSGDGYVRVAFYEEEEGWTVLGSDWQPSDAVLQGEATNVLEVEAQGAQMTFVVNGQPVAQVEHRARLRGDVGLYAGAFNDPDVLIAFDNLVAEPLR